MNIEYNIISASLSSFLICLLIIFTKNYHGSLTYDVSFGKQKIHSLKIPRIDGLAIYLGLVFNAIYFSSQVSYYLQLFLISALPCFMIGFMEDIYKNILPRWRLFGSFIFVVNDLSIGYADKFRRNRIFQ